MNNNLSIGDGSLFIPARSESKDVMRQYGILGSLVGRMYYKITDINIQRESLNKALFVYCNLILILNGQPKINDIKKIYETSINNSCNCCYLGNKPKQDVACKIDGFEEKKRFIMNLLKNFLIHIFTAVQKTFPIILENTNEYIDILCKSIELYCHFIGSKDLRPIYFKYIESLVYDLNTIFYPNQPILIKCYPDNTGYGCGRIITKMPGSGIYSQNEYKIIIASMNNSGSNNGLQNGSNLTFYGGTKKSKKTKKSNKNKL
jgi:hypothetical protein